MSGIGGMLGRGHSPRDRQSLQRLGEALAPLGDEVRRFEETSQVAMVFRRFQVDGEDRWQQPFLDDQGCLLTWDGRLDNGPELTRELALASRASLPEIISSAYRRWGLEFPSKLIGDFALAWWDPLSRRLCLAVDGLGSRPLYYHYNPRQVGGGRLVWANRARALVQAFDIPLEIDDDYVAAYLANGVSTHSPFIGIQQIPGGHLLVADDQGIELKRCWSFDPELRIEYTHDLEYEEHFRYLFEQAVACRLRAEGPVFAELSGGLDSSSIVCIAYDLMRRGEIPEKEIETISYVFSESSTADESAYIETVEKAVGKAGTHFDEREHRILSKRLPLDFAPDLPTNHLSFLSRYDATVEHMRTAGGRVVLSGIGGDQALWSEAVDGPVEIADLWAARRPFAALRRAYCWSRVLQAPLGRVIRAGLAQRSPIRGIVTQGVSPWLQTDFVERTGIGSPPSHPPTTCFRQPSKALQHARILHTMRPFALQRCQSAGWVEVRYPFLDRRLLEFVLAIPLDQLIRPDETRSVMRRALKSILPQEILHRRTKAGPGEAFLRALIREREWLTELFADPLSAQIGIVDRDAFLDSLHRSQHGVMAQGALMQSIVSFELWLRTIFDGEALAASAFVPYPATRQQFSGRRPAHARE